MPGVSPQSASLCNMARRAVPPLPIERLHDNLLFIAMPAAGTGLVFRLIAHDWVSECAPLPSADHDLAAIARAHRATWRRHRPSIVSILSDVLPALDRARAHRLARRQNLIAASDAATAVRRRAWVLQSNAAPAEPVPMYAMGVSPKREAPRPSSAVRSNDRGARLVDR